jgi:polysaccharide biosynthesis/export protein
MRSKGLCVSLLLMSIGLTASVHSQTQDPIQALKDSLSQDQQGSILQNVLGKGDGTGKKTDPKLNTPDTVQSRNKQTLDLLDKTNKEKTRDGRILRQLNEDPELRADDTVLIELTSIDDICTRSTGGTNVNGNGSGSTVGANGNGGTGASSTLSGLSALAGAGAGVGNIPGVTGTNGINVSQPNNAYDLARCPLPTDLPKTDAQKETSEKFQKRILRNNPYQLNRFGVLELPGLPAIPVAGLTAIEATKRLSADPDLSDYFVKLTLLRLLPSGQEALKPFGYDLFEGVPSTFAPVSDIQVPIDYIVGPGDTLEIQLYGNEPASYELSVQRDGRINFPKLGPIMVSNMTFDQARNTIEQRVGKQLIGTRVSVTIGDLRSIRVFVLGEAEKPGSYTVSGLSTMTNALFVSGGVKKIGSLRNIELKRNGQLVSTLDLYDLLLHGDTSGDRQLLPGDVIFIPPIGNTVSVDGAVRRPAIYELKTEKTVAQIIDIAGGLNPDADAKLGQLERILPSKLRQMQNIDLTLAASRATPLDNGDKLTIPEIRPTLENSVQLTGYVFRPGAFEYRAGLRLSDVLESFDELRPNADPHYIMIRREVPPQERVEVISADLTRALGARGSAVDPELRPRDQIFVFNLSASRERILQPVIRTLELQATPDTPEQIVSIDGRVKAPGRYPLEPSMHVSDLIRAGGSLEDAAYRGQAELTRYSVTNGDGRQTELIPVDLAAIWRGTQGADIQLQPYDVLVIKPIPMWMEPGTIELAGEVRFPGKYPIHQGETLHSVLQRAGGFTDIAFPEGAVFIREELKKREKDQLELLANRLESDLAALSLEAVASSAATSGGGGGATASQGLVIGQQLLGQLRQTKPVGRLVIDVEGVLRGRPGGPDDVLVKDGDKLVIPKKTQEITILGEVQSPTSHVFEPGLTRDDYIAKSGGATQKADRKRIYVVRANGDVISGNRSGWFRRSQSVEMHPGDTIVVPLDTERVRALPLWQAVTTIIYNLAIGFILVHEYL